MKGTDRDMMDKTKRIFRLYLTLTLLLSAAVVVLRTIALLSPGFDRASNCRKSRYKISRRCFKTSKSAQIC